MSYPYFTSRFITYKIVIYLYLFVGEGVDGPQTAEELQQLELDFVAVLDVHELQNGGLQVRVLVKGQYAEARRAHHRDHRLNRRQPDLGLI